MGLFVKIIIFAVILAIAGPFFMKGPDGKPLMTLEKLGIPSLSGLKNLSQLKQVASSDGQPSAEQLATLVKQGSGKQIFYKWQDEHGIWQFTTTPPPNKKFDTIETNANANIIQSLSKEAIDNALGRSSSSTFTKNTPDLGSGLDGLGGLSPTTVPVTQIPKLLNDAKTARQLMEQHTKNLEGL